MTRPGGRILLVTTRIVRGRSTSRQLARREIKTTEWSQIDQSQKATHTSLACHWSPFDGSTLPAIRASSQPDETYPSHVDLPPGIHAVDSPPGNCPGTSIALSHIR